MGHWREVFGELWQHITTSGLDRGSDHIYITVVGARNDYDEFMRMNEFGSNVTVAWAGANLELFEYPSIALLQSHCRGRYNGALWYVHTKGVSRDADNPLWKYWRRSMLEHVIDGWQQCHRALMDGYAVAGTNWTPGRISDFAGNWWWATSDHIRRLPDINYLRQQPVLIWRGHDHRETVRLQCEKWIGMTDNIKVMNFGPYNEMYHLGIHTKLDEELQRPCAFEDIGIDEQYVINLKRNEGRLKRFRAEAARIGLKDYRVFEGIDGPKLGITHKHSLGRRQIGFENDGLVGCFMSHYLCIRDAIERGYQRIVIYEDDVKFMKGFNEVFRYGFRQVPEDWEFLILGYVERKAHWDFKQKLNDYVVIPNDPIGTHAYMIQGEGLQKVYAGLQTIHNHIDYQYARMILPQMKAYAMYPAVCTQGGFASDVTPRNQKTA